MPYITKESREWFSNIILEVQKNVPQNSGELNYLLSSIVKIYVDRSYPSYQALNDVIGALEGAKLEFYRRTVVPFEEAKLNSNGDI